MLEKKEKVIVPLTSSQKFDFRTIMMKAKGRAVTH